MADSREVDLLSDFLSPSPSSPTLPPDLGMLATSILSCQTHMIEQRKRNFQRMRTHLQAWDAVVPPQQDQDRQQAVQQNLPAPPAQSLQPQARKSLFWFKCFPSLNRGGRREVEEVEREGEGAGRAI
eukprot:316858-Hanusia_phi.AAC.1